MSHGLLVAANYTYSHEIDNGSNGSGDGDEIQPQNLLCQTCETASGTWDARHVVKKSRKFGPEWNPQPIFAR